MQKELQDITEKQQEIIRNQEKIIDNVNKLNASLKAENTYLKQELDKMKRTLYGRKSERFVAEDPAQLNLFDTPEVVVEQEKEEVKYTRMKNKILERKGHSR